MQILSFLITGVCSCSAFESELADVIPVVKTSIAGTRIIGRMCAGMYLPIIGRL